MDEQRFLLACRMQDEGKLIEAVDEFVGLADDTDDPVDKAGILLNAATTLRALGQYNRARLQVAAARTIAPSLASVLFAAMPDDRIPQLHLSLDLEEAETYRYEGNNQEALRQFDNLLAKYRKWLSKSDFRHSYEMIQTRHAFLLADVGQWKQALPILKEAGSFKDHKEGITFYLGHCYLSAGNYNRAEEELLEALRLGGLPEHLKYRAQCELGITYYRLEDYAKARQEFEKCVEKADASYIKESQIWKWLENTCRNLGLRDEAERYARLAMPS